MSRLLRLLSLCLLLAAAPAPLPAQAPAAAAAPWWQNGVCYEVFVRSFHDSDGDGIGDLPGLTRRLDYINDGNPATGRDLGARCIWLMPIAQSPSYHGYDVTNYYAVNRDYGTEADFRELVAQAHRRGIRVLVDLVLNHSSAEHPHFVAALMDPASPHRERYLWAPTQRAMPGWSATVWHRSPAREEYYYGLFWSGMPDLNLASPAVREEARRIARFWLQEMGADGFRFDAVGHFFERSDDPRHGPEVHPWLRDYQAYLQQLRPGAFTVGEVWDSLGAQRAYYPDQLDSYFAFELSDSLLSSVRSASARPLLAAMERAQAVLPAGRWSLMLRNHDQHRTLHELQGSIPRNRVAATLLLTLPGIPFVYYGEEIGMNAARPDPRVRTPMQWARRPGVGFTGGTPWQPLLPDSLTANVEAQDADSSSLLAHFRRLIHLRAATPALGATPAFVPLRTGNDAVIAYLRRTPQQTVLVLANLGERRAAGLRLAAAAGVLPPGRYRVTPLLGGRPGVLRAAAGGSLQGAIPTLEPFESQVLELAPGD